MFLQEWWCDSRGVELPSFIQLHCSISYAPKLLSSAWEYTCYDQFQVPLISHCTFSPSTGISPTNLANHDLHLSSASLYPQEHKAIFIIFLLRRDWPIGLPLQANEPSTVTHCYAMFLLSRVLPIRCVSYFTSDALAWGKHWFPPDSAFHAQCIRWSWELYLTWIAFVQAIHAVLPPLLFLLVLSDQSGLIMSARKLLYAPVFLWGCEGYH